MATLSTQYREKQAELATKRQALAALYADLDKTTDPAKGDELKASIKSANVELADLVDAFEPLNALIAAKDANEAALKKLGEPNVRPIDNDNEEVSRESSPSDEVMASGFKSIHELIAKSDAAVAYRERTGSLKNFRGDLGTLAIKTLITSADMTPLEDRQSTIVGYPTETATVSDLMLPGTTSGQKVTYFEETTFTNAAAETDEGAEKQESALDFTLREDMVRKIATWIPVTDEMLEDVPGFESYLRGRLAFMVKQREELQLLQGAGTGVTIQGVYKRTGVQTVTGYQLSTIDSILKAITLVQSNAYVEPTAMVVHPLDWFDIRTSKDTQGNYLLGPATQDPATARPWGLQMRVTTAATQNTGLVGAFNQAQVFRRSGIAIAISTENEDYFIYNKLAVRAEERLALAVYRPSAFCKVEAIVQGS